MDLNHSILFPNNSALPTELSDLDRRCAPPMKFRLCGTECFTPSRVRLPPNNALPPTSANRHPLCRFRGTRLRLPPLTDVPSAPQRTHPASLRYTRTLRAADLTTLALVTRRFVCCQPLRTGRGLDCMGYRYAGDGWSPRLSLSHDSLLAMPKVLVLI